ncbi:MAG: MFS transporter, partial [Aquificales bacterium]|nr:MFS transporter [Aquificales bacterium]
MAKSIDTQPKESFLQEWGVLLVMGLASFILVLDTSMMNVAISAIVEDLGTTVSGVQAAITIYALVMASFMLLGGKLGDIYGMKKTFIVGMIFYGIGTITAALTPNLAILILGWSVIEGIGAAFVLPMTITMLALKYSGKQLAMAFGVVAGVQAAGAAIGPIFGGFMTSFYSWRLAFASEAIIVIIIFALLFVLPESEKMEGVKVDWLGAAFSALGLAVIVLGIILSSQYGWVMAKRPFTIGTITINPFGLSITPVLIALGFGLLLIFLHWEQRLEKAGKMPLLHVGMLKNGLLMAGVIVGGILNIILGGIMFTTPLFLQSALDYDAMASGMALLPMSIGIFVFSLTTTGLGRKFSPKYVIMAGLGFVAFGLVLLFRTISPGMSSSDMIVGFFIFGMGIGLILGQLTGVTLASVPAEENNEASGVNFTFRQLGISMGTAVIGAILLTTVSLSLVSGLLDTVGIDVSRSEVRQISVVMEDAVQSMTTVEKQAALDSLSPETVSQLNQISLTSWVRGNKMALI